MWDMKGIRIQRVRSLYIRSGLRLRPSLVDPYTITKIPGSWERMNASDVENERNREYNVSGVEAGG
jgi:hypothetical protein